MADILTAADFAAGNFFQPKLTEVDLNPIIDRRVFVKQLATEELTLIVKKINQQRRVIKDKDDVLAIREIVVAGTICDSAGNLMFAGVLDAGIKAVSQLPIISLHKIYVESGKLNPFSGEEIEEEVKNSSTPQSDSTSA